ncbi:helix-turn-helix domain-containing protein [Bacillus sp. 7884-1]|uniref:helix-turn-helix domain-containing protein n=1 Tax=Bacillus sp. 7884-1 TaxID=2021693 RepID=UPI000BA56A4D|nr:helix-turn-helix transcriptional regulator [Bacillus sp. 7884-1]PAE37512.1 transcriptional regulator [Bacillus sp. 7884-1]
MVEFLGDRIQNAREIKKLSAKEACELCNVTKSMWSLYESNKRTPSVEVLKHIAVQLNVSTDYLLGLTDEMKPKGE